MGHRIEIDSESCMSSGRCVADLPAVFRFDPDEIAELVPDADLPADLGPLVAAVRNCPAEAIVLRDDDGVVEA